MRPGVLAVWAVLAAAVACAASLPETGPAPDTAALERAPFDVLGSTDSDEDDREAFPPSQLALLQDLNLAVSLFSAAGALCVMGSYLRIKALQKLAFRLVFFLSLCDLGFAVGNTLGSPADGSALCYVQAYAVSFFVLAAVLWTTVVASVLDTSIHRPGTVNFARRMPRYHMAVWGVSVALTLAPATTSSYGPAGGGFCWIRDDHAGEFWRFIQLYIPLWLCMAYNASVYTRCFLTLREAERALPPGATRSASRRRALLAYPLVLVFCWTLATVNRVQNWISPRSPHLWLYAGQIATSSAQGLCHALVFFASGAVRLAVRNSLCPDQVSRAEEAREDEEEREEERLADEHEEHERRELEQEREEDLEFDAMQRTGGAALDGGHLHRRQASLADVTYQVRGTYAHSLGLFMLMGLHDVPPAGGGGGAGGAGGSSHDLALASHLHSRYEREQEESRARSADLKVSDRSTYVTLFKSFVGIGVLAMPHAYANAGYVAGTFGVLLLAWLSYLGMVLLLACRERMPPAVRDRVTFSMVGRHTYGEWGQAVVDFAMVTSQCGFAIAYFLFIGENASLALGFPDSKNTVIMVACAVLLPLVWLRSLKRLAFSALVADVAVVFAIVVIFVYDFRSMSQNGTAGRSFKTSTLPLFFGMVVFAFEGIGLVLPIVQSMRHPSHFPGMLRNAMAAYCLLISLFGSVGYVAYGDDTDDIITLNLPHNALVRFTQLLYCLGLWLSAPIVLFPAYQILEASDCYSGVWCWQTSKKGRRHGGDAGGGGVGGGASTAGAGNGAQGPAKAADTAKYQVLDEPEAPADTGRGSGGGAAGGGGGFSPKFYLFRAAVLALMCFTAIVVPHFGLFIGVIGAVSCSLLAFVLPPLFYNRLHAEATRSKRLQNWGLLAFGIVGGIISFSLSLKELIEA